MCMSSIFAGVYNMIENILICIIIAIFSVIPLKIVTIFLSKKKLRPIGFFLYVAAFLTTMFMTLVNAALMDLSIGNEWGASYIFSFILDVFFS